MVIDSSSLLAIALGEPDDYLYIEAIAQAVEKYSRIYLPASVLVEAGIVVEQRNYNKECDALLNGLQPEVVSLDRVIAEMARQAFRRFGKGRHPAKLNFGDCMSYATAQHLRLPLLYKGEDFRQTDIQSALKVH